MNIAPPIFAHRGASHYAPENTLAAFWCAKQLGIRWLEFDVMLTADQQVVVIHDETVNRTTNGKGKVSDYTYEKLRKLDAGGWFSKEFAGEKIPLLSEVIAWMRAQQMCANIEIKSTLKNADVTAEKVLQAIDQSWSAGMPAPLISSFSLDILRAVRRLDSHCQIGLLLDQWQPKWQIDADKLQVVSVHTNAKVMTAKRAAEIHATQRLVFCYTVNTAGSAKKMYDFGVDALYSDRPDVLMSMDHV